MCLAIPLKVVAMEGSHALCEGRDGIERIDTLLTGPLAPGQWVLSFLGAAREVIEPERAAQILDAVAALSALLAGEGDATALVDAHFSDLVGREPQLPDFLKPATRTEVPTT